MLGSMEPMTHMMAGACLARVGFNRKAAYATLAMTLAAEAPDLDTLWSIGGPVATFQHHRGITHTLIGLPLDGLIVLGMVWVVHRWRVRRGARAAVLAIQAGPGADQPIVRPLTAAPLRWGLLFVFALIASLSHILLDWTNNYGVRPFFPFNPRWYAGSFVFIF
jgi:inner membrane protein